MLRQFSAGGVVIKKDKDSNLYLIRQDSHSGSWTLPKGWLDDSPDGVNPGPLTLGTQKASEDQIKQAAIREVAEETGVEAEIIARLASVQYFFVDHLKQKVLKTVIFYLMEYKSDLPAGFSFETTQIAWLPKDQAQEKLKKRKQEASLIAQADKYDYNQKTLF